MIDLDAVSVFIVQKNLTYQGNQTSFVQPITVAK